MAFVVELECQPGELVKLRAELGEWLVAHHVPAQTAFHVKLVAHEAAKNAIDHADPCDQVGVTADLAADEIIVQVADTNVEPWELPPATEDQLRGLRLIDVLSRRVELVPLKHGTALLAAVERR